MRGIDGCHFNEAKEIQIYIKHDILQIGIVLHSRALVILKADLRDGGTHEGE